MEDMSLETRVRELEYKIKDRERDRDDDREDKMAFRKFMVDSQKAIMDQGYEIKKALVDSNRYQEKCDGERAAFGLRCGKNEDDIRDLNKRLTKMENKIYIWAGVASLFGVLIGYAITMYNAFFGKHG